MVKVAGVRFKTAGKIYYFDPGNLNIATNLAVVVETARGLEFGITQSGILEMQDDELVLPLKKIVRIATKKDIEKNLENQKKKEEAMRVCREKIVENKLQMKLVEAEYTFDEAKIIFYFTADGRVDFRELVKDLAFIFKTRIELRQIGVRDEAKSLGGVGNCGRCLCCNSWLPEFNPVSIKMAKVQNLPLNPTKISGICGRLMCCLKYENDIYKELRKGLPEVGEKVNTPEGKGVVTDSKLLESKVKVRLFLDSKGKDEELSDEYIVFDKDEVQRLGKQKTFNNKEDILKKVNKEDLEELNRLMQE